jgi:hypothetical protein
MLSTLKRFFGTSRAKQYWVSGAQPSQPTLEALEDRFLLAANLFGVGTDGRVYEQILNASGHAISAWNPTSTTGKIVSNVTVDNDLAGTLHLFGVGTDGRVYEQDFDRNDHAVTAWYATSTTGKIVSNVTVEDDFTGAMHLFGVGTDGRVYEQDFNTHDHAVTAWYATSTTGKIVSNVSVGGYIGPILT